MGSFGFGSANFRIKERFVLMRGIRDGTSGSMFVKKGRESGVKEG